MSAAAQPTVPDWALLVVGPLLAAHGLWTVLMARDRMRCKTSLARMTRVAELTQRALVRPLPADLGGLATAVRTRSASEGALVGGDLHDAVLLPSGPRLIVGDVTGHGLDAVRISAAVLAAFRHSAAAEPDLVRLAHILDDRVRDDLGDEDFVTLLLADFVPGVVRLVNCGHPSPLLVGRGLEILESPCPSPPLGLSPTPSVQAVLLTPEQRMLFYTDGLTEARDAHGTLLALDRRVRAALSALTLDEALTDLVDLVDHHTAAHDGDGHDDDLTLLLVQPTADLLTGPVLPIPENEDVPSAPRGNLGQS
ncbi:serine/threonine-protein phosphatase [Streptomyces sp. NBC_00237]|uniref:PP2C family protein-serine/threonine phosphatase n=1 Tax=Streptomyces sp. NBC_00237 TaxID=2975687 RepID=UPI00224C982B|nr:PP2C family protein-serine/threonine phosphatase [Streptomyces sp. NBC_00237]MCX5205658.1 serine/threonine-protein phosphatase [Streptomyces sp. NBC_00237]